MRTTTRRVGLLALYLALATLGGRAQAGLLITINQVGNDVVVSGSGTLDTADLTNSSSFSGFDPEIHATEALVTLGPIPEDFNLFTGLIGPSAFGPGNAFPTDASSGSGDAFGILGSIGEVALPMGYVSGTALLATNTYSGQTISSLGLTLGTYVYTAGSTADADTITLQINPASVPEPSTLISGGLAALLGLGYAWRRRRA